MRKHVIVVAASLGLLVLGSTLACAAEGVKAFGKTLDLWMQLDNTWRLGGDQDNPEGKMVFLPDVNDVEATEDSWTFDGETGLWVFTGELDVTLQPGQKFAMPLIYSYGEAYEDGSDPELWRGLLEEFDIQVTLDGKVIVDSEADNYGDFWYGPVYFDEMIEYFEPAAYGVMNDLTLNITVTR